jgi:glycolate oxidase FAD binding subunit
MNETQGNAESPEFLARHASAQRTTLGGSVASGINGPGRWRYGGLRDFILEVRFIDGSGTVRRGGRRVVKNAAGFDIPKLMVGSCGRLGVLADVTLKVFPKPKDYLTLHFLSENLDVTLEILSTLGSGPWDIDAIETQLDGSILVRLAGEAEALAKHGSRIQTKLTKFCSSFLSGAEQQQVWAAQADWLWGCPTHTLVKVPLTLRDIFELDEELSELDVERIYGSCGNVAWLRWPTDPENSSSKIKRISKVLKLQKLQGLVVQGPAQSIIIGHLGLGLFYDRLSKVFDPHGRLGTF